MTADADMGYEALERLLVHGRSALDALVARAVAAEREAKNLREALTDLLNAVDAVCDCDSVSPKAEPMLPGHARTVLELAAQRSRSVLAGEPPS